MVYISYKKFYLMEKMFANCAQTREIAKMLTSQNYQSLRYAKYSTSYLASAQPADGSCTDSVSKQTSLGSEAPLKLSSLLVHDKTVP